ncbi:MAG: PilZ domain-containing protein [Spirochaetia bacterium]|jgi:hypothetical protein|nr:PilZ domain-containing protein [Spirochaetales bacterium]
MGKEQRKSPRNKTYAKVLLEGSSTLGYLRDLSRDGCQLALIRPLPVQKGDSLTVSVLPVEEMGIPRFSVTVEIMWIRSDPVYFLVGATIAPVTDRESEERLEELFKYYA